jgi:hypothetical protein
MIKKYPLKIYISGIIYWIVLTNLFTSGCSSVKPSKASTDRIDYGQVIAESWKRQTLLNVVRLRYADAPVFLEITSIINSNSVGGNINAGTGFPGASPSGITFDLGGSKSWSNTPTVSYQPLMGERFTRSLLEPIPPSSVFQLIQGGWPAEMVFSTIVSSINGMRNSFAGVQADSAFLELVAKISEIQRSGGLGLRIEAHKEGSRVVVVLPHGAELTPLSKERHRIRELLQLQNSLSEFQVVYGLVPQNDNEVALISRSMLEIMLQLGFGIDIPPAHIAEGRVLPGYWHSDQTHSEVLSYIHSGLTEPEDVYVAVQYKDCWYWIEDTDLPSKRLFTFLMILFSLAETGQTFSGPVVTVPSR